METANIMFNICVPVYKAEAYLRECVHSVLIQDYKNYRIFLVDDGSPDRSGEICDQLASGDDRIFAIHQTNQGQIMARQAALQFAQTLIAEEDLDRNYMLFLDSDDLLKENALERIAYHIGKTRCDMLIYGIDWYRDGKVVGEFRGKKPPFVGTVTDKAQLYQIILGDMVYNSLCRKAVSARLVKNKDSSQYSHLRHGEDLLQSLTYLKDSKMTVFVEERLYKYRINPVSVTHTLTADTYQVDNVVRSAVLEFLAEENVWNQEMYGQYYQSCGQMLFQEILRVSAFPISWDRKKKLFDEMNADAYYRQVLSGYKHKTWVLRNFERKKYNSVVMFAYAYLWARNLKQKLR